VKCFSSPFSFHFLIPETFGSLSSYSSLKWTFFCPFFRFPDSSTGYSMSLSILGSYSSISTWFSCFSCFFFCFSSFLYSFSAVFFCFFISFNYSFSTRSNSRWSVSVSWGFSLLFFGFSVYGWAISTVLVDSSTSAIFFEARAFFWLDGSSSGVVCSWVSKSILLDFVFFLNEELV
jgi:hypothetical protein